MAHIRGEKDVMIKEKSQNRILNETTVRAEVARYGYRLMHRRNGQYWVMLNNPMTLDEIDMFLFNEIEILAKSKELDRPRTNAISLAGPDRLRITARANRRMRKP
jgi:hypothetical protein